MNTPAASTDPNIQPIKKLIQESYQSQLKNTPSETIQSPEEARTIAQEKGLVRHYRDLSARDILHQISDQKTAVVSALDQISNCLTEELARFQALQKSITLQNQELDALYGIQKEAGTLSAILKAQEVERKKIEAGFAAEREVKREEFEREQAVFTHELTLSRRKAEETFNLEQLRLRKDMEREKLLFDKDMKDRETAMTQKETAIAKREADILAKETEVKDFRRQIGEFSERLNDMQRETRRLVTEELEHAFQQQLEGLQTEHQKETATLSNRIFALEEQIKDMDEYSQKLKTSLDNAGIIVTGKVPSGKVISAGPKNIVFARRK